MSHLSQSERETYTAAFLQVDLDGNGALDMEEFKWMCKSLGFSFPAPTVKTLFDQIDTDGNGTITLDKFLASMPHTTNEETREEANLRRSFNEIDKDGDGFLTAEEVRRALRQSGRNVTMEQAQKLVEKIDTDGDGRVSVDEFIAFGKKQSK